MLYFAQLQYTRHIFYLGDNYINVPFLLQNTKR